jgi:hypothetical protein
MSLVTSVKDYVEITHKLIEVEPLKNYTELGALLTYFIVSVGNSFKNLFNFSVLNQIWSIPIIIPDVAAAMISEISVLDGYFHNAFTFLETSVLSNPSSELLSNSSNNTGVIMLEKFFIGLINSFFLFLPTSTSHLITIRRFVMQGLEAGYMAGLGTLAGNFLWLASIILGWRFFVIPWLSFDIFRYLLGFILIVKYIWDSSKEQKKSLEDLSKSKIFLLNFLLAVTEQTCIYPFISNLSFGPEASILEGFPVANYSEFLLVHGAYLFGILLGSFSLLQFTCWFWENPAFSIYIWITTKSSYKISTSSYYKVLNFVFLYVTMLCAIASIPYYGLDYTITNPVGLVPQDRILEQKQFRSDTDKVIPETAFLGVNPTDKNTRIRDGVHARRERWKQRLIKYQAYDASVYDQGVYDFLTVEDLNYGFDRFWLRRKMRNHQIRFRLFPGPWMRSLKKQLNQPSNLTTNKETSDNSEGYLLGNSKTKNESKAAIGPRIEFFRILFEQFYHPNFHAPEAELQKKRVENNSLRGRDNFAFKGSGIGLTSTNTENKSNLGGIFTDNQIISQPQIQSTTGKIAPVRAPYWGGVPTSVETPIFNTTLMEPKQLKYGLIYKHSALRKFVRNVNTRLNLKRLKEQSSTSSIGASYNTPFGGGLINSSLNRLGPDSYFDVEKNLNSTMTWNKIGPGLPPKGDLPRVYSKRWKSLFSKIGRPAKQTQPFIKITNSNQSYLVFRKVSKEILLPTKNMSLKLASINQKLSSQDINLLVNAQRFGTPSSSGFNPEKKDQLLLLRPLSFYLQKEQAFKRKLRYYGATTMRKLTVGNQAPYFKTLMKRGFFYFKPSLRLKKTFYAASMRRGFRKKSRKQKTLVFSAINENKPYKNEKNYSEKLNPVPNTINLENMSDPTQGILRSSLNEGPHIYQNDMDNIRPVSHPYIGQMTSDLSLNQASYSVLNKRASRYRHQIYKDVLQHWYYTPFNRLALKFDIDAFINRQPKVHSLTKNEERLLHIKRLLLSEHYDTLRWYTYMEHYRTMKTNIGGTKSFASRVYNQQFQGTFKKIRHLFAVTPTQDNLSILKFDQPLYNTRSVKATTITENGTPSEGSLGDLLNKKSIYIHEELLNDQGTYGGTVTLFGGPPSSVFANSLNNSVLVKKNNTQLVSPLENISELMPPNNIGGSPLNQSKYFIGKQYLESTVIPESGGAPTGGLPELKINKEQVQKSSYTNLNRSNLTVQPFEGSYIYEEGTYPQISASANELVYSELFVKLIKECKRQIYDQTFLKNYISHRIEKRDQRNQEQTKELNKRLEKLKVWLNFYITETKTSNASEINIAPISMNAGGGTAGGRDLLSKPSLLTTGMQKALNDSIFITKEFAGLPLYSNKPLLKISASKYKSQYNPNSLAYDQQREEKIKTKLLILKSTLVDSKSSTDLIKQSSRGPLKLLNQLLNTCKKRLNWEINYLKVRTDKDLNWWRQKQRVLTKRKNTRKRDRFKKLTLGEPAKSKKNLQDPEGSNVLNGNYDITNYLIAPEKTLKRSTNEGRLESVQATDSSLLRRKQENLRSADSIDSGLNVNTSMSGSTQLSSLGFTPNDGLWRHFFVQKLRKKVSTKGRRYKSLSFGRYLTATREPKLVGNQSLLSLALYGAQDTNEVTDKNALAELEGLSKMNGISSATGFILNKSDKQERLNLENTLAETANISKSTKNIGTDLLFNVTRGSGVISIQNLKNTLKRGQINKRSRHAWKKAKRYKFNTSQNKYKKRRIQSKGKLRVLSKKLKKLTATQELRQWWWHSFLPRYYNNMSTLPAPNNSFALSQPLNNEGGQGPVLKNINYGMSPQNNRVNENTKEPFKPLSKLDNNLLSNLQKGSPGDLRPQFKDDQASLANSLGIREEAQLNMGPASSDLRQGNNILDTTSLPFYAGWDESLRKFVVTNRLLSRRDAGLEVKDDAWGLGPRTSPNSLNSTSNITTPFINAPVQGLNEGSFLYWQTDMPFNAYTIDQFISTNQSFYAPVGWRRFEFRHSILKSWYRGVAQINQANRGGGSLTPKVILNAHKTNIGQPLTLKNIHDSSKESRKVQAGLARRVKKRYKLLKQMPNQLMYSPTGPLLIEVLPSHYISVFDQQYRLPRNRYLKRNLLKTTKKTTLLAMLDSSISQQAHNVAADSKLLKEFTLRKRVKPRRKYHRKRFIKKEGLIFPRRTKFTNLLSPESLQILPEEGYKVDSTKLALGDSQVLLQAREANSQQENLRWRPSSRSKQKQNLIDRSKNKSNKRVKANPLRLRQLRRREFQQIFKPTQRYQPRNGGFTWPGDYLRLESVEMPKLTNTNVLINTDTSISGNTNLGAVKKTSLKQKINVQPVGIMPRKYLFEKHNILVLKKKLEKAHTSHKLAQVVKEYKLLTQKKLF